MIHFRVALIPRAWGRPRAVVVQGRARMFSSNEQRANMDTFSSMAAQYAPAAPLLGPLAVTLRFDMPTPASWPGWRRENVGGAHHESRPDLDNLIKLVLDSMQKSGAWWRDDAQVSSITASKGFASSPGTTVTIDQLEQPTRPVKSRITPSAQPALFSER